MNVPVVRMDDGDENPLLQTARDHYAGVVGRTLMKHYPTVNWLVEIKIAPTGGVAFVRIPEISKVYGMIIKLSSSDLDLESSAIKQGGEMLERFNIPRLSGAAYALSSLKRGPDGEALNAKKGEV
jgi:hypothetical protein